MDLWTHILRHGIAEVLQQTASITPLRAEACAALATIGSQIFECLPVRFKVFGSNSFESIAIFLINCGFFFNSVS